MQLPIVRLLAVKLVLLSVTRRHLEEDPHDTSCVPLRFVSLMQIGQKVTWSGPKPLMWKNRIRCPIASHKWNEAQSRFNLPEKYLHFDNAYPFQTRSVVFSTTKNYQSADKESKAIFAWAGRTTMTSNVLEQIWNLRSLWRTSTTLIGSCWWKVKGGEHIFSWLSNG